MFCVGINEYWIIAISAEPQTIRNYQFGAEAMIYHGGEKYRTAETYANSSLYLALLSILSLITITWSLNKFTSHNVLKTYIVGLVLTPVLFIVF
jgi:hypothetical protein